MRTHRHTRRPPLPEPDAPPAGDRSVEGARRPRQARGQRRVDAILDAAAALVAEHGLAGVTMQAVASRSGTASGSLYHFFPDRESVLCALAERHAHALRALAAEIGAALAPGAGGAGAGGASHARRGRSRASVETLVDRFLEPLIGYVHAHPELLAIAGASVPPGRLAAADPVLDAATQAATEQLVGACDPSASPGERVARAATINAALEGTMARLARCRDADARSGLVRELKRLLVAYLATTS